MSYEQRCIRQYKAHTRVRENGDLVVGLGSGLFDLFSGIGFGGHSRYRIVRTTLAGNQLINVGGLPLSREYREQLLKEHSNGKANS